VIVAVVGFGRYTEEVVETVSEFSEVLLLGGEAPEPVGRAKGVRVITGSPTDLRLWRELNPSRLTAVVSLLDPQQSLDVARILRRVYRFRGAILFIAREEVSTEEFRKLRVEIVPVPEILGAILRNHLKGRGVVRYPVGIGLRKGEVVELLITESSPAVYMRLSEIRQRNVRVALIYREGGLILPRTDLRLQPGDRLLVVGEPSRVELFVRTVTEGAPNFPFRWGTEAHLCGAAGEEVEYLREKLKVKEWVTGGCEKIPPEGDAGILLFGKERESFWGKSYVDEVFLKAGIPSLFLKGTHPYRRILVSANTEALGFLLPNAVDFARLVGGELHILYVTPVEKMMGKGEREALRELESSAERLGVKLIRREGNPVRETLRFLGEGFNLLTLGYTVGKRSSFFRPYTPHILARRSPVSTLLIPEVGFER